MTKPITFTPLPMERVWGGRAFENLGKTLPAGVSIGELWEIVDRPEARSVVASGCHAGRSLHELWTQERMAVFGPAFAKHPSPVFPLLVKLLDASDTLSVQVHPPLEKAAALGGEPKTEMWYFLESRPGAVIHAGLKRGTTREDFEKALATGRCAECLHTVAVHGGESIFIPSGRLHAIGAGNLIVEIQQNSDTTYRVFDWNRTGLDGKPRDLHVSESLASIDFADFEPPVTNAHARVLADCPFFRVEKINLLGARDVRPSGGFAIVVPVEESVVCGGCTFGKGSFFLVPASLTDAAVSPCAAAAEVLVATIPA
jgi:mannose-6-phosphate isomerase